MSGIHVIGIDPSLSGTGIAYDNNQTALVRTHTSDGDRRLQAIYDAVYAAAGSGYWKHTPALAVIEDLPVNARSAGKTGQAQGVTRMALCMAGVSILAVPPATLKAYAVGKGNATKEDMIHAWNDWARANESDDNRVDAAWLRELGRTLISHTGSDEKLWVRAQHGRIEKITQYLDVARAVHQGFVIQ